ncbi:MAG: metallophosphoesterase [Pirellulales bacterium]
MVASIEYIEEVVSTYEAATEANWKTPGREGNVVQLTPDLAEEVMVTADVHGHRRNFNLIKKHADLAAHPGRHLILQEVCHGGPTYPTNGGCMSHSMLEDVAKLKVAFPERVHFILSNHELAELTDYPILKSKKMLNLMFRLGMQEVYGAATERVRGAYLEFLRSCPLAVRLSNRVWISHSVPEGVDRRGFDAGIFTRDLDATDLQEHGDVFDLVWGRDYRPENAAAFARLVDADIMIHGHDPCPTGFRVPNDRQIILDCCAEKATYLIVPVAGQPSHAELVERIRKLA